MTTFWLCLDYGGSYTGPYHLKATEEEIKTCFSFYDVVFEEPRACGSLSQEDVNYIWQEHIELQKKREIQAAQRRRKMYEKLKKEFE